MKESILRKIYREWEIEIIDQVRGGENGREYAFWSERVEQARRIAPGEETDRIAEALERREQLVMEECFVQGWRMGAAVLIESLYGLPRDPPCLGEENA